MPDEPARELERRQCAEAESADHERAGRSPRGQLFLVHLCDLLNTVRRRLAGIFRAERHEREDRLIVAEKFRGILIGEGVTADAAHEHQWI